MLGMRRHRLSRTVVSIDRFCLTICQCRIRDYTDGEWCMLQKFEMAMAMADVVHRCCCVSMEMMRMPW